MERILTQICVELNNWFTREYFVGKFAITDGTIALPDLKEGQYFRIFGSALNDGVYRYPAYGLQDEVFRGSIGIMYIPPVVLGIAAELEIAESATAESGAGVLSPFSSESFNGYSCTRATNKDGTPMSAMDAAWASALRKLRPWRKHP